MLHLRCDWRKEERGDNVSQPCRILEFRDVAFQKTCIKYNPVIKSVKLFSEIASKDIKTKVQIKSQVFFFFPFFILKMCQLVLSYNHEAKFWKRKLYTVSFPKSMLFRTGQRGVVRAVQQWFSDLCSAWTESANCILTGKEVFSWQDTFPKTGPGRHMALWRVL